MAPIQAPSHSSGDPTLAVSGLVIGLAVVSYALRFYIRLFTKAGPASDDWLVMAAAVATLATAALLLWGNIVDPNGLWVSENTNTGYVYTAQASSISSLLSPPPSSITLSPAQQSRAYC